MNKTLFLFFIGCFVALCAALFLTFYTEAKTTAIRQLNEAQRIHAQQAAQGIGDFFQTWTGILNSFAKMDEIVRADEAGKRYQALFYEAHQGQIKSITRVDERGRILYAVPDNGAAGRDISGQQHMQEILRDHRPVVSDVFRAVQGFDGVALHVPVFKGTTFKGTIAIVIDFEKLAKRYLEVIRVGKTGYAWVLSRSGTTLYSPVPGFTGKSVFENGKNAPELLAMAKEMLQGRQGQAVYTFDKIWGTTVAPVKKYAVYMPIPVGNSFWSIVVASSEDEVFASLATFRNRLVLVIGMILCGGVLFSIVGAKAWLIVAEEQKRRSAEEGLRESEQYNRLLFELSPIGLVLCRMDGALVNVNAAYTRLIGRTVEETLQLNYWDITPASYAEQEALQLKALEETGHYGPYEKAYRHKDGHLVPVRLQGRLIEKDGEAFIWSSADDISERKQIEQKLSDFTAQLEQRIKERTADLEEKTEEIKRSRSALQYLLEDVNEAKKELEAANARLQEIDRLKSLFIASMSHELRTPLNSVIGYSSILLNEWLGPLRPEQKENLAIVLRAGKHLLALINDVIDVSKIEAGQIDVHCETFDLFELVAEAVQQLEAEILGKGLGLSVENRHVKLHTDRRRLLQALLNLLGNAMKYTPQGSLGIAVANDANGVDIAIRDSGIGIAPEDLARAFQPFTRFDSPLRSSVAGTGLGLYLTHKLVTEILHGDIACTSQIGQGSTFHIHLPRTSDTE